MALPYVTEQEMFQDKVDDAVKLMKANDKNLQDCMRFDFLKDSVSRFDTKNEANDVRFDAVYALVLKDEWPIVRPTTPGTDTLHLHLFTYIPKNSPYTASLMHLYHNLFEQRPWVADRATMEMCLQILTDNVLNTPFTRVDDLKLALDIRVNWGFDIQYLQDNWLLLKQSEVLKHMLQLDFKISRHSEFGKMFAKPSWEQREWFQEARKVAYNSKKDAFKREETARAIKRQKRQ